MSDRSDFHTLDIFYVWGVNAAGNSNKDACEFSEKPSSRNSLMSTEADIEAIWGEEYESELCLDQQVELPLADAAGWC